MALIKCPDCGKELSDAAPSCIQCGRPMLPVPASPAGSIAPVRVLSPTQSEPARRCRKCGGTDLRAVRVLYQMGQTSVQTETHGAGVGLAPFLGLGSLGLGFFGAKTQGTHSTQLAESLAPPQQRRVEKAAQQRAIMPSFLLVLAGIAASTLLGRLSPGLGGVVFLVAIVACAFYANKLRDAYRASIRRWNETEYPRLKREWENSALCMTCGERQPIGEDLTERIAQRLSGSPVAAAGPAIGPLQGNEAFLTWRAFGATVVRMWRGMSKNQRRGVLIVVSIAVIWSIVSVVMQLNP